MSEELGKKKIKQIADDRQTYKIDIMRIQEHYLKGTGVIEIRSKDNKVTYELFYMGPNDNKHNGLGIIVRKDLKSRLQGNNRKKLCSNNKTRKE